MGNPITKKSYEWLRFRKKWLSENQPNFQGYYECYLCSKWVLKADVTLDHIIPRSRRPDLKLEESNVRPCCYACNSEKGSKVYGV